MIKQIVLKIGLVCLLVNLLFGLILSMYSSFNIWVSSLVIVINVGLLYFLNIVTLRDGFKTSLMLLFGIGALVEYAISLFLDNKLEDNLCLIGLVALLAIKCILLMVSNIVSNKIE